MTGDGGLHIIKDSIHKEDKRHKGVSDDVHKRHKTNIGKYKNKEKSTIRADDFSHISLIDCSGLIVTLHKINSRLNPWNL